MLSNMFLLTIFVILEKPNISLLEGERIIHNQPINEPHNKIHPKIVNFSEVFDITNSTIDFTSTTTIEPKLYVNSSEEESDSEYLYNFSEADAQSNFSVKSKKKLTKGYLSLGSYSDAKSMVLIVTGSVLFAAGLILAVTNSYRRRKGYKILNSTYTNTPKSYGGIDHN